MSTQIQKYSPAYLDRLKHLTKTPIMRHELPSVDDLEVSEFHKVCMLRVSHSDNGMNFFNQLLFLLILLGVRG